MALSIRLGSNSSKSLFSQCMVRSHRSSCTNWNAKRPFSTKLEKGAVDQRGAWGGTQCTCQAAPASDSPIA